MNILILTWRDLTHPAAGGAEVYTEQVARRWVDQGHHVTLVAATVDGRPGVETIDGYRVVRLGNKYTVYREARKWWEREGRYEHFDVVLDMINTVAFRAHRWVKGVPTVGFAHQTCEEIWHINAPAPAALLGRYVLEPRWLKSYADVPTLAVSQSTKDALQRFGIKNVSVVPEGFEPPDMPVGVPKQDRPTLVWCARMIDYKRPLDMLQASVRLRGVIPDLQVWMIGGGPELEAVRELAPAGIDVLGFVDQQEKLERMAAAHIHVATSVREGWGLVVSEAAALGTPTVAYDVPGLRDSTRAAGGVVVPPDPDALVDWIPTMLDRWRTDPPPPVPFGGAHSWDDVAADVMTAMLTAAGLPESMSHPAEHVA